MNKIEEILNQKWTKTILTYVKSVLWIEVQDLSILCTQIIKKNKPIINMIIDEWIKKCGILFSLKKE